MRDCIQVADVSVERREVERVAWVYVLQPLHRASPPRIADQRGGVCGLLAVSHPPEQHWVRLTRVVTPERDHVGSL